MRILVVTNLYPPLEQGGYGLSCHAFVEHLRFRGHEVRVLTTIPDEPVASDVPGNIDRTLRWYRRSNGSFASPGWLSRCRLERHNCSMLRRAILELKAEAVMWWNMGGMSLSLIEQVRRSGLPAVGIVCDYWMIWGQTVDAWLRAGHRSAILARLIGSLSRVPMRVDFARAARWVFVSEYVLRETLREVGDLPRTAVVHSGIATRRFVQASADRPWSGRLLMVGRLTRNKGVDIALEALAALPECTLDIYGHTNGEELTDMERSIDVLGLRGRVTIHPHVSQIEIERLYARYDALLFPVRWDEPFGRVPLEAMASRVAVVAAARGGARDYLRHEENCLVANDAAQVRSAVERLASDEELRSSVTRGGTKIAPRYDVAHANAGRERALRQTIEEFRASRDAVAGSVAARSAGWTSVYDPTMRTVAERVDALDDSLFDSVRSQTYGGDRRSLLAVHASVARQCRYRYLEIGSYLGGSLQAAVADTRCVGIVSIDPRPTVLKDERLGADETFEYPDDNTTAHMLELLSGVEGADLSKLKTIEASTSDLSPGDLPERPDLCLVDGEHSNDAAFRDAAFCAEAMRWKGVIAFHDANILVDGIMRFLGSAGERAAGFPLPTLLFVVELGGRDVLDSPFIWEVLSARSRAFWRLVNLPVWRGRLIGPGWRLWLWTRAAHEWIASKP